MRVVELAAALNNSGFKRVYDENGIAVYGAFNNNVGYGVGIVDCSRNADCDVILLQTIRQNLLRSSNITRVLFVVFTWDIETTRIRLRGDCDHWLYDGLEERLLIYEDQPADYLGLRAFIENNGIVPGRELPKRKSYNYLLTVTNGLVLINIIVFIYQIVTGDVDNLIYLATHGGMYSGAVLSGKMLYTVFTSLFMHASIAHLGGNMLTLLFCGNNLESRMGKLKYLVIYVLSGIIGNVASLAYYAAAGKYNVVALGASGAVFGVIGAYIAVMINDYRFNPDKPKMRIFRIIIWVLLAVYQGVRSNEINVVAHVGGLIGGFVLGLLLCRKRGNKIW